MHIISGEIILSHCHPMSKRPEQHLSGSSFRSSPQVPVCKTHDWSQTKQAITALTASINHLPSGIRAEEEEIKRRKTNSYFLAQMFYQQNQKHGSQYCLLFLVCAACDMALQENSSPSKCILSIPCVFSYHVESEGFFVCRCWMGLGFYRYLSPLFSSRAGPGELSNTARRVAMVSSSVLPSRIPDRYFTTLVCSASPHPQHKTINHF